MEIYQQQKSKFHIYRQKYQPRHPAILNEVQLRSQYSPAYVSEQIGQIFPHIKQKGVQSLSFAKGVSGQSMVNPLRVGCVLSGGQAAGGHNVIVGLYEYIKKRHPNSQLYGFLNGPHGIYSGKYIQITESHISYYKNRGGFDMICSGRHKIETPEQFQKSLKYCQGLKLDGLVVIGGDDSNTNACHLAEYFLKMGSKIRVVGCPKTIDGDLKNQFVEVSFGFDTACKTYAQCIGSVMADTLSSKKYYHFIRLMGRSASHIALQCALLTRPTYTFIGEQVQQKSLKLKQLIDDLSEAIIKRAQKGKNYGIVLIPQGLIEFIPQVGTLIKSLNEILAGIKDKEVKELRNIVLEHLKQDQKNLFELLPHQIATQLLLDRDPHGNVQVAKIQTEKLIINMVRRQLSNNQRYKAHFHPLANYFGYQGRCAFPTPFDCDYCYSLGLNAAAIIEAGQTGLMSCIRALDKEPQEWLAGGYPLVTMMNIQKRKNKNVSVIKKALVDLNGQLFNFFKGQRQKWASDDYFNIVGPVQYQFPNVKPYLAVPPSLTTFYPIHPITEYKHQPFATIDELSINQLTSTINSLEPFIPQVLNQHITLINSQPLVYKTNELKHSIQNQYPFLFKSPDKMITFRRAQQATQPLNTKIGICFNGRQFPGAHTILKGLLSEHTQLIGFLGGTKGLFSGKFIEVTNDLLKHYVNQSGFSLLGRSSDRIRSKQELQSVDKVCKELNLNGLVLVGASHTLTDSVIVSQYLLKSGCKTRVIAVPASIDQSVQHTNLQACIGFATSSHMYSTLISNLMIDASSNTKYWYFIRLMGRDPSFLTLECALATHPNYTIISEQVKNKGWDLDDIVDDIVRVVIKRHQKGLSFGCILIPEGLLKILPTIQRIKNEIDQIKETEQSKILEKMSKWAAERYQKLPYFIKHQLHRRDSDTNQLAYSQIQTQKMLAYLVQAKLLQLKLKISFAPVCHFFGYQGRCALPNKLDRNLSTAYGRIARILIENNLTGYCPSIRGATRNPSDWFPIAIPLLHMLQMKQKSAYGINKPVVKSSHVNLSSPAFQYFSKHRIQWELFDHYESPGPIQHFGQLSNYVPLILTLDENYDNQIIEQIQKYLHNLKSRCKFGANIKQMKIIKSTLSNLLETLRIMQSQ